LRVVTAFHQVSAGGVDWLIFLPEAGSNVDSGHEISH
jgi:hypothetical protein